jgi:hypothetical protein
VGTMLHVLTRNQEGTAAVLRRLIVEGVCMTALKDWKADRAKERGECAAIADECAQEMLKIAHSHPAGSDSRDRCFARAREAERIATLIRARAER